MRDRLTHDDIERVEMSAISAAGHREAAARLLGWAEERHPQDEVSPADLVAAAAWHLDQAGDAEGALDLHRRAVSAGGTTTPDARCLLAAALFDAGRPDEARQVADELRRSRPRLVDIVGMEEVFELAGDLQQANRWVAMGMARLDLAGEADDIAEGDVEMLFNARRRVRRELGFPEAELED